MQCLHAPVYAGVCRYTCVSICMSVCVCACMHLWYLNPIQTQQREEQVLHLFTIPSSFFV